MPVLPSSGENGDGDGDSQCGGDGNGDDDDDLGDHHDISKEAQGGKERELPGDFLRELTNQNAFFPLCDKLTFIFHCEQNTIFYV